MPAYREPAVIEPEPAIVEKCPSCGGPHDIFTCAQIATRRAKRFALFATIFAAFALVFNLVSTALRHHWLGL